MWVKPEEEKPQPPEEGEEDANPWKGVVMPFRLIMYARVDVDAQAVVDPFDVRNWPLLPKLPVASKSFWMVERVVVASVPEAFVKKKLVVVALVVVEIRVFSASIVEDEFTVIPTVVDGVIKPVKLDQFEPLPPPPELSSSPHPNVPVVMSHETVCPSASQSVSPAPLNVPVAVMLVAVAFPETKRFPPTESLCVGELLPIPTFPPSRMVKTSVPPSKTFKISPVPDWVIVRRVVRDVEAIVEGSSARTKSEESIPSRVSATKAAGTAPSGFRGESVSHDDDPVPPTSTSR